MQDGCIIAVLQISDMSQEFSRDAPAKMSIRAEGMVNSAFDSAGDQRDQTIEEALEDALLVKDAMVLAEKLLKIRTSAEPRSNVERKALRRKLIEFMRGWSRE